MSEVEKEVSVEKEKLKTEYALPSAFKAYTEYCFSH